ncbi:hypothetical protein COM04_03090 [Bacillus wiedmannii]|nr:hypothetical protein BUE63_05780 [Bacillus sp. MB353a]PEO74038.1 hypothetical protein CN572_08430 [Bacillus wiedmannii]QBJ70231.1 hypothetical protein C3496_25195 [Bacillus anthracis]PEP55841.1 hypothetical protein CN557_01030 [Bacillus wiedmannii]PEP75778.1 hypothetical protein CN573_09760 [Bacillus wiedmannii]
MDIKYLREEYENKWQSCDRFLAGNVPVVLELT